MIRGFAILTIILNHLTQVVEYGGLSGWFIPTPTRLGYSSAAELFVIMSGYMVGLVYLARPGPSLAIWRRAWTLYCYDIALFAIVLPLALLMTAAERKFWGFTGVFAGPLAAAVNFLTLQKAPRLLDILQLYILLMLVTPVAIAIQRRSTGLLMAVSVAIYAVSQVLVIRHLAAVPEGNDDGLLKLMSWQLLFFVPMALGVRRIHKPLFAWLDRNWIALAILLALFALGALGYLTEGVEGGFVRPAWFAGRYGLHLLRLSHAILTLLLYASLLACLGRWLNTAPFRAIGTIGRHSLDCFAAGVLATYALGLAWDRIGGGHAAYYAVAALGVAITVIVAYWRDSRRI